MLRNVILLLALLPAVAPAAPVCASSTTADDRASRYEIGLTLQQLLPSHLPGDPVSLPAYGPRLGIPLLGNKLLVQGLYGGADPLNSGGTSLVLAELDYQLPLDTPFFHGFFEVGSHFLHYSVLGKPHDMFGGNFGFGLFLPMGKDFQLTVSLKTYVQERLMISMGGGFTFLL